MASSSSSFANLKFKVKKDEDISKEYNKILHACLDRVLSDMRRRDETFGRLFRELYYGGSYFDKLAVGNLRHEFDLDVIFRVKARNIDILKKEGQSRKKSVYIGSSGSWQEGNSNFRE